VTVNGLETPWGADDLAALAAVPGLDGNFTLQFQPQNAKVMCNFTPCPHDFTTECSAIWSNRDQCGEVRERRDAASDGRNPASARCAGFFVAVGDDRDSERPGCGG
jgi:hypothetical protein